MNPLSRAARRLLAFILAPYLYVRWRLCRAIRYYAPVDMPPPRHRNPFAVRADGGATYRTAVVTTLGGVAGLTFILAFPAKILLNLPVSYIDLAVLGSAASALLGVDLGIDFLRGLSEGHYSAGYRYPPGHERYGYPQPEWYYPADDETADRPEPSGFRYGPPRPPTDSDPDGTDAETERDT